MKKILLMLVLSLLMSLIMVFPASASDYFSKTEATLNGFDESYFLNVFYPAAEASLSDFPYKIYGYHAGPSSDITKGNYQAIGLKTLNPTQRSVINYCTKASWTNDALSRIAAYWKGEYHFDYIKNTNHFNIYMAHYYQSTGTMEYNFNWLFILPEFSNFDIGAPERYQYFMSYDFLIDSSFLESLISQAKSIQSSGYTKSSWNTMQLQISFAENLLLTSGYTQTQIDNARDALQTAINGLVPLPDASALQALIAQAKSIQSTDYTASSFQNLQIQITAAENLLITNDYTQSQINNEIYALQTAIDGLVPLSDTSVLQALIAQAKAIQDTGYTASSWQSLQAKIAAAENLLLTNNYTQSLIEKMVSELKNAMGGLQLIEVVPPEESSKVIIVEGAKWYSLQGDQKKYADLTGGVKPEHLEPIKEAVTENIDVSRKYGFWAYIITLLPLLFVIMVIVLVRYNGYRIGGTMYLDEITSKPTSHRK